MYIERTITKDIENRLFQGKIIVIYGPRRVGKTTLVRHLIKLHEKTKKILYLTGDDIPTQNNLTSQNVAMLKQFLGDAELVIVDEAQRINNIGINLKLIVDSFPNIQLIATGSSSFDLANKIKEPLTGRTFEYFLPPFSLQELSGQYKQNELVALLDNLLLYGLYPDVFLSPMEDKERKLKELMNNYLFKDILAFEGQKNSGFVFKLLQLLAFQAGNEVSYNELAKILEVGKATVEKYINLLEQTYVIYKIGPFSRNLRNEIGKKRKIYFWDVGIKNALIQNFNNLNLRTDIGSLWENFYISERIKYLKTNFKYKNVYYWRTYDQKEIDYLEESDNILKGYEIKWGKAKARIHKEFLKAYKDSTINIINKDNFLDHLVRE